MGDNENTSLNMSSIVVILPRGARDIPEKFGGGYVRFKLISPYFFKYINVYMFYYRSNISIPLFHFLHVLSIIRKVRKARAWAVLTVNPSPMDVWIGRIISSLSKVVHVVILNAVPLSGFVGYRSRTLSHRPALHELWEIIKISNRPLRAKLIEIVHFFLLFRSLRKSIIIPLTPDVAQSLRYFRYTYVNSPVGVGCAVSLESVRLQKFWEKFWDAVYVASPLHPDKGLYDVVDVWELVVKELPNAKLLIAGKKDPFFEISRLREYIEGKNIGKNIFLLPSSWLPREMVLKLISRSKLLLYPTRKDQTPLVISEALGLGVPVVTYDLPGISYAYGSCPAVIRVKVGDKQNAASEVVKLLREQHELENLSSTAVRWCVENSWDKVALKTITACLQAVRLAYAKGR
ncbi:MAG: glycosyltransferase [Desulfurococcaceae archaeon]